jgi:hypothetical protein
MTRSNRSSSARGSRDSEERAQKAAVLETELDGLKGEVVRLERKTVLLNDQPQNDPLSSDSESPWALCLHPENHRSGRSVNDRLGAVRADFVHHEVSPRKRPVSD